MKNGSKKMMWAYLMHLADNMWADPGSTSLGAQYYPELQVDDPEFDAWCDRVIAAQEKAKTEV